MQRTILTGTLLAGALTLFPAAGAQAATPCSSIITGRTLSGPVTVSAGTACELNFDQVNGAVTIGAGAALSLYHVTITGGVTGTGIQSFDSFAPVTIDGAFSLTGVSGVPDDGPLETLDSNNSDVANYFDGMTIHGATTVTGSSASAPWTDSNSDTFGGAFSYTRNAGSLNFDQGETIGGAMNLSGNTGGGLVEVSKIGGSLTCGNTPLFAFFTNQISGHNGSSGGSC